MTAWQTATLSDVLTDAKSGFACGKDPAEGMFQFRMNNITTEGRLDFSKKRRVPRDTRSLDSFVLQPGDVLFNATNSPDLVGKSAFFPGHEEPAVFSNHFLRLRPREEKLDGRYLARWLVLQFQRRVFYGMCRQWVNQATVNRESLLALRVPLPSLHEQQRIAEVLDRAEALRAKRRAALTQLDSLTQSLFLDLFGDPTKNEKNWPFVRLDELASVERGKFTPRPRNDPSYYGGRFPFIQTGDISNSEGRVTSWTQTLNEKGVAVSRSFRPGTVVIAIVGATLGMTAILDVEVYCPDSVVGLQARPSKAAAEYIERVLRFWRPIFVAQAPETARANINLETLRPLQVPAPPLPLQREFARRVLAVEKLKTAQRASLAELDALFATLQHRAFRGELS
jgi:type I restriction enzyme S subunit